MPSKSFKPIIYCKNNEIYFCPVWTNICINGRTTNMFYCFWFYASNKPNLHNSIIELECKFKLKSRGNQIWVRAKTFGSFQTIYLFEYFIQYLFDRIKLVVVFGIFTKYSNHLYQIIIHILTYRNPFIYNITNKHTSIVANGKILFVWMVCNNERWNYTEHPPVLVNSSFNN